MVFERDIPSCSPREVLIQYLRRALIDILQQVQNGIDSDCISFRLENLIDLLLRSAHLYQDGGQVLAVLRAALTAVENCRQSEDDPTTPAIVYNGMRGRPRMEIHAETLKFLLEFGFNAREIASMLSVSIRTIQRRMANFNLREEVPRYTLISDNDLDETCREIISEFPNCGVRRMRGFLLSMDIRVSWERIREAMRRTDPEGVLIRSLQLNIVHRREYSVRVALALWHIDSNHKLIRYTNYIPLCSNSSLNNFKKTD